MIWTMLEVCFGFARKSAWFEARRMGRGSNGGFLVVALMTPLRIEKLVHLSHLDNPWGSAFATDLLGHDSVFLDVQWWVFGHTHYYVIPPSSQRAKSGSSVNQRGYPCCWAKIPSRDQHWELDCKSQYKKLEPCLLGKRIGLTSRRLSKSNSFKGL